MRDDVEEGKGMGDLLTRKQIQREMEKKETHTLYHMVILLHCEHKVNNLTSKTF